MTQYLSNNINQCRITSCYTCNIFINDQSFKSNLTGKKYKTISCDRLSCGSTNVIYGIHCVHCGLVYVGETERSLRLRMSGHRSAIKKEDKAYYTPLTKLLAQQARPGRTHDGSGTKAETDSSISATNQHQSRQKICQ